MKIEQTKLYPEFKKWVFSQPKFKGIIWGINVYAKSISYNSEIFEIMEGVYRAFLRETRGINIFISTIKVRNGVRGKNFGKITKYYEGVEGGIKTGHLKEYPEAFINLITEIFNNGEGI